MHRLKHLALGLFAVFAATAFTAAPAFASGPPFVETKAATSIGETTATLNGAVNPNGATTKYHFEYGTTTSYGKSTTEVSVGSGTTNLEETKAITELTAGASYHFRIVATNSNGTSDGADKEFTTAAKPALPEFVPHAGSKGEMFPLPVEGKDTEVVKLYADGHEAMWCKAVKVTGSITGAKTAGLTLGFENCRPDIGEHQPCTNFSMSGTGSLVYLNKATKAVGVVLPLGVHYIACDEGAFEEKYKGTIISPITPINTETTKPELRYALNTKMEDEITEYENEKGEKVATKFEWSESPPLWERGGLWTGAISLTSSRGLTIKS